MKLSSIFAVIFLTLCAEILASAVWTAGHYSLLLRMLLTPAVMLLICAGLTWNFLKKSGISREEAGIVLPQRDKLLGIMSYACLGAGIWLLLVNPANTWLERLLPFMKKWGYDDGFWRTILTYNGIPQTARHVILIYTMFFLAAAEEIIFRGFLLKYLTKHTSPAYGVFWSAMAFSLVHINPHAVVMTLPLGLLLGGLMVRTGNIFAPIAAHFIFNTALIYLYGA